MNAEPRVRSDASPPVWRSVLYTSVPFPLTGLSWFSADLYWKTCFTFCARKESMGFRITRRGFLRAAGGAATAIPLDSLGYPTSNKFRLYVHSDTAASTI